MADDTLTLAELLVASTAQDAQALLMAKLAARELPVTNWQPTGLYRSLVAACAEVLGDLGLRVPVVAASGFLKHAKGAWLTMLAKSAYGLDRLAAGFAVVRVRLTNSTATPHTISPSSLWMRPAAADTRRWVNANTANVTLPASSTVDVDFRAEFAGSGYNLAYPGPPALALETPLPGVTIAAIEVLDSGGAGLGTVMVTAGADEESDGQLRARCEARWGDLAWAGPVLSYASWARAASASVRRVFVDDTNPGGPGTVTVYLASDSGGVGGSDVTAVNAVIQVRKPPTAVVTTQSAGTTAVTLAAQLVCPSWQQPAARTAIYDALVEHQRGLPISSGSTGKLRFHALVEILMAPAGVEDVNALTLNGGTANVQPPKGNVVVINSLTPTLPWLTFVAP